MLYPMRKVWHLNTGKMANNTLVMLKRLVPTQLKHLFRLSPNYNCSKKIVTRLGSLKTSGCESFSFGEYYKLSAEFPERYQVCSSG